MKRVHMVAGLLVLGSVMTFGGVAQAAVGYGAIGVQDRVIKAGSGSACRRELQRIPLRWIHSGVPGAGFG
jgi:hypothetical protein